MAAEDSGKLILIYWEKSLPNINIFQVKDIFNETLNKGNYMWYTSDSWERSWMEGMRYKR